MALPKVKYEPLRLFLFYYENCQVTKTEIAENLSCSFGTGSKIYEAARAQMRVEGIPQYHPQKVNVEAVFKVYGWDIKRIEKSVKVLGLRSVNNTETQAN